MAFLRFGGDITDDAGNRIKLLDPAGMSEWPVKGDTRIAALLVRVRRAMSSKSWIESLIAVVAYVAIMALFLSTRRQVATFFPGLPRLAYFAALIMVAVVLTRLLWRVRLHSNRATVVRLILEEGLCPSCGYNFSGLGVEGVPPHGRVACPECGGAWRRDRIERVLPFAAVDHMKPPVRLLTKRQPVPRWSTLDDRGARVALVHPGLRAAMSEAASETHRQEVRSARAEIARNGRWVRRVCAVFLLAACVAFGVAAARDGAIAGGVLMVIIFLSLALAATWGNFAYSRRRVRERMLAHELCPSCAARLTGREPSERDACVVCPGCRAAWRVSRSPAPPRSPPTPPPSSSPAAATAPDQTSSAAS